MDPLSNQGTMSESSLEIRTRKKSRVDPRNTIGDVPLEWYADEEHIGYDKLGRKVVKKEGPNRIDSFLVRRDNPNSWRTIYDEVEDEFVEVTEGDMRVLQPHAKFNRHLVKEAKLKQKEKKLKKIERVERDLENVKKNPKVKESKLKKKEKKLKKFERAEGENVKKNPKMNILTKDNRLDVIILLKELYNITPPLKVLLDDACFGYMQKYGLSTDYISHLFASVDLEFYITRHTVEKLNHLGGMLSMSVRNASKFLKVSCVNGMRCSSDAECLLSMAKNDNIDSYIVATPDEALCVSLRQMNVPLLRCAGGEIVCGWSSEEQRDMKKTREIEKSMSTNQHDQLGSVSESSLEIRTRKKSRVDPRNTIGDVPLEWYADEEHIGYDKLGRKIVKKEGPNRIDSFLARRDNPNSWRTIYDEVEDESVEITKGDMRVLQPHAKFNRHLVKESKLKEKEKKKLKKFERVEGDVENVKKNPKDGYAK